MAVPAPAIPTGNAYTVNVARPHGETSALPAFVFAAAPLLRRWKIPVRLHLAGDTPSLNALRLRLNEAGARPSAFSPAPSNEVPGEGFWKTTLTVVEPGSPFWALERDDKKVEWDPLLIALSPSPSPENLPETVLRKPDLWIVPAAEHPPESPETSREGDAEGGAFETAGLWSRAGAGAVCAVSPAGAAWHTGNAVFGRSTGSRNLPAPVRAAEGTPGIGAFAAGVVAGLLRDLLSENLFDKTLLRADRECLEMRPLRLGRAVLEGLAAREAFAESGETLKGFAEAAEARRVALLGPASRPWAHKGR